MSVLGHVKFKSLITLLLTVKCLHSLLSLFILLVFSFVGAENGVSAKRHAPSYTNSSLDDSDDGVVRWQSKGRQTKGRSIRKRAIASDDDEGGDNNADIPVTDDVDTAPSQTTCMLMF